MLSYIASKHGDAPTLHQTMNRGNDTVNLSVCSVVLDRSVPNAQLFHAGVCKAAGLGGTNSAMGRV